MHVQEYSYMEPLVSYTYHILNILILFFYNIQYYSTLEGGACLVAVLIRKPLKQLFFTIIFFNNCFSKRKKKMKINFHNSHHNFDTFKYSLLLNSSVSKISAAFLLRGVESLFGSSTLNNINFWPLYTHLFRGGT